MPLPLLEPVEAEMAYYLEIKFYGPNQPWQWNPNEFPTKERAFQAGLEFCLERQPDPKVKAQMWELTRDQRYAPETKNVEFRVMDANNEIAVKPFSI